MKDRKALAAWILAGLASLFLLGSLTGDGTGPGGQGLMTSFAWAFVVVLAGAFLYWLAMRPHRPLGRDAP